MRKVFARESDSALTLKSNLTYIQENTRVTRLTIRCISTLSQAPATEARRHVVSRIAPQVPPEALRKVCQMRHPVLVFGGLGGGKGVREGQPEGQGIGPAPAPARRRTLGRCCV